MSRKYAPGEAAYPLTDKMAAFGHHTPLLLSLWRLSIQQGLRTWQSRRRRRTRSVSGALELGKPPHPAPPIMVLAAAVAFLCKSALFSHALR